VLKKGQIVDRGLDPKNEAELVVELDRYRPHRVFDPRSFDADVETVAHLAFVLCVQFAARESGYVVRLHGMDRRARQVLIDRLQIRLFAKDDVGSVFALVHTPVISGGEVFVNRAAQPGQIVQPLIGFVSLPRRWRCAALFASPRCA
jgi:hypothetical protein